MDASTVLEGIGIGLILAAVAVLAGPWWAVLAVGVLAVGLGVLIDAASTRSDEP